MENRSLILINMSIAKEYLELARKLKQNQKFSQEVINLLTKAIRDRKQLYTRLVIAEIFGYLTMHHEVFLALKEIFLEKEKQIEGDFTDSLNYVAGNSLMKFSEKHSEVKELFLHALRDSSFATVRLVAINLLGNHFKESAKELIPIFRKIIREDKSQKVRIQAWQRFVGLVSRDAMKKEQETLKREIVYSALYKVMEKIQPGLQVSVNRIIELSDQFYYEKAEEMRHFGIDLVKFPDDIYIELIKEILDNRNLIGKYFDFEQVFVREGDADIPVIAPLALTKEYICYHCGIIIDKEAKSCPSCENSIPKCNVCKLPISFGEEAGKCSLCEAKGHMSHLQEWVKIKGKCPTCQNPLPLEHIVPLSADVKK